MLSKAVTVAQDSCTVNLDVAPLKASLNQILSDAGVLNEVADFGVAAPLTSTSPVTDGMISAGEYPNICTFSFADRENPANPYPQLDTIDETGDADLSLKLHTAHTDQFLFLGFEVTDEFLDLEQGVNAFTNDSVELFVNSDIEPDDFNPDNPDIGRAGSGEGFQIVADAAGDGDIVANNRAFTGASPVPVDSPPPGQDEFYSAGLPTATGHIVEFQIRLDTLDTVTGEDVKPATTGDVFLFNFVVNDNDFEGAAAQDTHGMLWVVEEDPRSPFGGGENVWMVPLALTPGGAVPGDLDGDGDSDADDIDALAAAIRGGQTDARFDLNVDGMVNAGDHSYMIGTIQNTYLGDSNLDREFSSSDFVFVFQRGEYEDNVAGNSGWADGDWNGSGDFDSADFVVAFQQGGYEKGPMAAVANVPEPAALALAAGLFAILLHHRRRH
jgi:hypothetical protein